MIAASGFDGERVGVFGLARSGLATARALRAGGATPVCWDDAAAARDKAAAEGFEVADLAQAQGLAALIASPGAPHLFPAPVAAIRAAWENCVPVDNDIGLFCASAHEWRFRGRGVAPRARLAADDAAAALDGFRLDEEGPHLIAVTGSNGKSTTTALIGHILAAAGIAAQTGGNIGRAAFDLETPPIDGAIALELSSYQTDLARDLWCDIGVFLNLSPDHLDRHGGEGGYLAAKRRLFDRLRPGASVIGVDDDAGRFLFNQTIADNQGSGVIAVSARGAAPKAAIWSVSYEGGDLIERIGGQETARIAMSECPALAGAHNGQNAAAAFAACRLLGLGAADIAAGMRSFGGLPHRMERVATRGGVLWVNDSKATNADAAEKALLTYDRVRWIAGGVPKAGGIAPLKPLFGKIAKAYLIGQAAAEFAATLGDTPHEIVGDMQTAVARIAAEALPGDVALLSPACASFDQFNSYEHRGDQFRAMAQALEAGA